MKRYLSNWQVIIGLSLIVLSGLLYLLHYTVFSDSHHIFIFLLGDIAFVPIEVLLVTLIIHRLLTEREKRSRLDKLNMIIGAFFSEVGSDLLVYFSDFDPRLDEIRQELMVTGDWDEATFMAVSQRIRSYDYGVQIGRLDLERLRRFLRDKRDFMVRLLENPVLLEHEGFTELLRAVFHLTMDLAQRKDVSSLPDSDYQHLTVDIKRAYVLLVHRWLDYMKHLKGSYPYLFSLAMRTNPFAETASPVVT